MPTRCQPRLLALVALHTAVAACGGTAGSAAPTTRPSAAASAATTSASPAVAASAAPSAATSAAPAMLGPTDGALTLVEPLRDQSAWQGSVAITPSGSLAMVESGTDGLLDSLACAVGCGNPATWSAATLDPGVAFADPLVRALDDGSLVAVVDSFDGGQASDELGFCSTACDGAASWSWTRLPLPADSVSQRASSRYFAVGGGGMIIGLGSGSPMGALVCGGTCNHPASWMRVEFSTAACRAPSVAAGPNGAMAFACVTSDPSRTPTQSVEVWSCPGQCATQASWTGVTGLAAGDGLAADVTVNAAGMVGVAVSMGRQATATTANRLGWFQCLSHCSEPASWHGVVVGDETLYGQRVAAITDAQGRSLVAYDGTSTAGSGLLTAACTADCAKRASWTVALLDDAKRVASQIVVATPAGCDAVTWKPDNVTDITLRGDWAAIASGYSAIGTGGTCTSDVFSSAQTDQPVRSVVSLAVVGP